MFRGVTMKRYFYLEVDHLSDRGYTKAVEVYKVTKGYPQFIVGNYRLNSENWRGVRVEALQAISKKLGYKLRDSGYYGFKSPSRMMADINGNH